RIFPVDCAASRCAETTSDLAGQSTKWVFNSLRRWKPRAGYLNPAAEKNWRRFIDNALKSGSVITRLSRSERRSFAMMVLLWPSFTFRRQWRRFSNSEHTQVEPP